MASDREEAAAAAKAAADKAAAIAAETKAAHIDTARRKSGDNVWVQCKLPHGIWLHLDIPGMSDTPKPQPINRPDLKTRIRLNGANSGAVVGARGRRLGYGLTEVPRDFWEAWVKTHTDFVAYENGMIRVEESRDRAIASSMDHVEVATGFESIDPNNPPSNDPRFKIERDKDQENRAAGGTPADV